MIEPQTLRSGESDVPPSSSKMTRRSVSRCTVADKGDDADICAGEDWIELFNPPGAVVQLLTNMTLTDEKGLHS